MKEILGIIIILLVTLFIVCHLGKLEFWANRRSNFRYKAYYKKGYYKNALETIRNKPFKVESFHNLKHNDNIMTASIYGNHPKYFDGLAKLIDNMKALPNWTFRIYCHNKCPPEYIKNLINNTEIETFIMEDEEIEPGNSAGMFWRFLPLSEDVTFISLDVDEDNILLKDPEILDIWLRSDCSILRTAIPGYPWPKTHFCGSYFGKKKGSFIFDPEFIMNFPVRKTFGTDEIFLQYAILPLIRKHKVLTYFPKREEILRFFHEMSATVSEMGDYKNMKDVFISKKYR